MITEKRLREVLNYDPKTGVFRWRVSKARSVKVGEIAGHVNDRGYVKITLDRATYRAHRLAWLYVYGKWPSEHIDHINGITDDNRISNLRQATRAQNMHNSRRPKNNTSSFKGVYWRKDRSKWAAMIGICRKRIFLGYFDCKHEAYAAYCKAAEKHHGEFAKVE